MMAVTALRPPFDYAQGKLLSPKVGEKGGAPKVKTASRLPEGRTTRLSRKKAAPLGSRPK